MLSFPQEAGEPQAKAATMRRMNETPNPKVILKLIMLVIRMHQKQKR